MKTFTWSDLYLGLNASFAVEVLEVNLNRFTQITGDINPLHLDERYAQSVGFKSRVSFGLLTASYYSTLVGVHLPGQHCLLHGIDIDFLAPVFIGDELIVSGIISHLNEAYHQATIKAEIINQDSRQVSRAKIRVGVQTK